MKQFEVKVDPIEVTSDGSLYGFGGAPADTHRRFVPGLERYFIDGEEVSHDEFQRQWAEAQHAQP